MGLTLEVGKTYRDGWGQHFKVMGRAVCGPVNDEVVYWTLQGNWYTASGRKCIGEGLWHEVGGPHDLQAEVLDKEGRVSR